MSQRRCSIGRMWGNRIGVRDRVRIGISLLIHMQSFTDLEAWKIGMILTKEIYQLSKNFPHEERFGLTSQIRRASVGILANLAEGFGRNGSADKAYKYTIARGECFETRALLLLVIQLEFLSESQARGAIALTDHTGKLLSGLIKAFSPNPIPSPSPPVQ